jgi:urea-proton symporter
MVFPETPKDDIFPPFAMYDGQDSYFGGEPPLSVAIGYFVVLGFGALFSVFTTYLIFADKYFGKNHTITSEQFK